MAADALSLCVAKTLVLVVFDYVSKDPINNIPALVQIMAWRRSGDKPLSEPVMVSLLTHIASLGLNELKAAVLW